MIKYLQDNPEVCFVIVVFIIIVTVFIFQVSEMRANRIDNNKYAEQRCHPYKVFDYKENYKVICETPKGRITRDWFVQEQKEEQ